MSSPQKQWRRGRRFEDAAHVNTAVIGRRAQFMGGGNADKNCAICTAAGVLNLALGKIMWTTSMVAQAYATSDTKEGMGSDVNEQVVNIMKFCQPMTGRTASCRGSMGHEMSIGSARTYMNGFPDGTVFAVNISGAPDGGGARICHWLAAIKRGGSIEYVDFQSDHDSRQKQAIHSDTPVLGITGATVSNAEMVVIAFPPG